MENCYNNSNNNTHLMQEVIHDSNQVLSFDQSNWDTTDVHKMEGMSFNNDHHQEQQLHQAEMQNGHQSFNSSSLPGTPYPPTPDLLNLFHLPRCSASFLLLNSTISFANPSQKPPNFHNSLGFSWGPFDCGQCIRIGHFV